MDLKIAVRPADRWSFANAGAVYGVVWNANYFVLAYYSQVLGLNPALAGLALSLALVVDAISDPLVGYLSDNTKSKHGRRHPYLYASILPLIFGYYLLWHPPTSLDGDQQLFIWVLTFNVLVRLGLTLFLVPAFALLAEMTSDYEERTRIVTRYQTIVSIIGNGFSVAMYAFWLVPTETYSDGVLNAGGYREAGSWGTAVIAITLIVFILGLRKFIPRSRALQTGNNPSPAQFFRHVRDVARSRSLRSTLLSGVFYYMGNGIYAALWVYIYSYFWEFTSEQISLIVIPMVMGGMLLTPILARFAHGREKKWIAVLGIVGGVLCNLIPISLRLAGWWPENGSSTLFWTMMVLGFIETVMFLFYDVCWRSMTADVTEEIQLRTGRRNEGVITSSMTFASKCSLALGAGVSGFLLSLISWPTETSVGDVPAEVVFDLGLIYGPVIGAIWLTSAYAISRYRISRKGHAEALQKLELD